MKTWSFRPARDLELSGEERRRSLKRETTMFESFTQGLWGLWLGAYLRAWHRFEVAGRKNIPRELPFVLVANHSSHLDALALARVIPSGLRHLVFPLAAGDYFFETSAMSRFATLCVNALPLWRRHCGRHVIAELRERLVEDACGYILFPEGSRSRDGRMETFKAGIGKIVAGTPVPVVPCWLEGAFEAYRPGTRWPRPTKVRLHIGPALSFEDSADSREGWREVTRRIEAAVRALRPAGRPPGERCRVPGGGGTADSEGPPAP